MLRRSVAQGIIIKMREDPGNIAIVHESEYIKAVEAAEAAIANGADTALLIEIAESGGYNAGFCLQLCDRIRKGAPGCRLLLLCPEQNEMSVSAAGEAMRNGRIDDFLFYDASIEFLVSKLLEI